MFNSKNFLLAIIFVIFGSNCEEVSLDTSHIAAENNLTSNHKESSMPNESKKALKGALRDYRFLVQRATDISRKIDFARRLITYPVSAIIAYASGSLTMIESKHLINTDKLTDEVRIAAAIGVGIATFLVSNSIFKAAYSLAGRLALHNIFGSLREKLHLEKSLYKQKDKIVKLASKVEPSYLLKLAKREENSELRNLLFSIGIH